MQNATLYEKPLSSKPYYHFLNLYRKWLAVFTVMYHWWTNTFVWMPMLYWLQMKPNCNCISSKYDVCIKEIEELNLPIRSTFYWMWCVAFPHCICPITTSWLL
jgi:hypothetical protein